MQSHHTTWFENVILVHNAIPEINFDQINLEMSFLKKKIDAPIIIGALTGGTLLAEKINKNLAIMAHKYQLPMMVGSQRIALEHPETRSTFRIARDYAPEIPLIANIGATQISKKITLQDLETIVEMINADALAIHLNSTQECIQPEGEPFFQNVIERIADIQSQLSVPIIIKETGAGIDLESARKIFETGINIIDVAGMGGTSFAAIEYLRAKILKNDGTPIIGENFWDWGIPTAASLLEARSVLKTGNSLICSGGIRTGIDIAKALNIGADICAIAYPFLVHAMANNESLENYIISLFKELRTSMFLTGCSDINTLRKHRIIIIGDLLKWTQIRSLKL